MTLNINLLKTHLVDFVYACNLTLQEVGELADESLSVSDFKLKLDELCRKNIDKTAKEVLGEFTTTRLAKRKAPEKPEPSDNSPLQNEIEKVGKKLDNLQSRSADS